MFDRVLNTPLWHSVYNSVYEGTSSKKTTGWENGLIIKVLEIHIKSTKKKFFFGGAPESYIFSSSASAKNRSIIF